MSFPSPTMGIAYYVKDQLFAAAVTDGLTVVVTKGALGRAGRSAVQHHDTQEQAIEMYRDLISQWSAEGYVEDIMPHIIGKSLQRHLTKEPLAKLALPVKFTPKVQAFV